MQVSIELATSEERCPAWDIHEFSRAKKTPSVGGAGTYEGLQARVAPDSLVALWSESALIASPEVENSCWDVVGRIGNPSYGFAVV